MWCLVGKWQGNPPWTILIDVPSRLIDKAKAMTLLKGLIVGADYDTLQKILI